MPRGKYPRRGRKRGPYRKKGKGRAMAYSKPRLPPVVYGIPTSQLVRMTFATQIRLNPTGPGVPAFHVFQANSIHKPDYSSISPAYHQPMYHDQYEALYANYKVIGSKISITGANDYSDQNNSMGNLVACQLTNEPSTSLSRYSDVIESKGTRYRQCQEKRPFKLVSTYSARKFHAIQDVKDAIELQGILGNITTGTNPAQPAYYVLSAHPLFYGQDSYPACLNIRIDYLALVYNHKRVAGS